MELIDIYDENNNYLGYSAERDKVHENNLWRRHVSAWIMNNEGKILMQQRSFSKIKNPGKWAKTGGHVDSGESEDDAIKREVFEEIGLKVNDKDIHKIEVFKNKMKEHYYSYVYIFITNLKENEFVLQKEEVESVKYFTIEELEQLKKENNENFTFNKWDEESFNKQIILLKKYRNKLKKIKLENLTCIDNNINIDEYFNYYNYIRNSMKHPEWLSIIPKDEIIKILNNNGKIWIYYDDKNIACSVFYIPSNNKSLMKHNINYDEKIVGSCGPIMVSPEYVGNGLQRQMLKVLNKHCKNNNKQYIFTKVHPDNLPSINNFIKDDYKFIETYESIDGPRNVYLKKL